jgi:hypothetical protein
LLAGLSDGQRLASWHLVDRAGGISSRGEAGIALLHALGYARTRDAAARASGPIERLYAAVAAHRDQLGRLTPDGPAPRRFP